jgi:hypothetical protein
MRTRRPRPAPIPRSAFAGFRFPPEVIVVAVRWYLRFDLSYRDVEEVLIERAGEVDPRQCLPLGAALHAAPGRGRPTVPASGWGPLVRGRDLREGRRKAALRPTYDRLVRPGHRRVRLPTS